MNKLLDLARLYKKEVWAIYIYAIMGSAIQLTVPLGVQSIIGFAMSATLSTSIFVLVFTIVLGVTVAGILQIKQMQLVEKIQQKIFVHYTLEFTEIIPNASSGETNDYYMPEKVNRFLDVSTLQKGFSKVLLDIPFASIQLFLGFILLALYSSFFILFALIIIAVLVVILKYSGGKGYESSIEESTEKYNILSWLQEMGRISKSLKQSQGTQFNLIKTDNLLSDYLRHRNQHFSILNFQYHSLVIVKVLLTLLMLALGSYLVVEQRINIGEFIAAEIVVLMLINASEKIIQSIDSVYDVATALTKLDSVVKLKKEMEGSAILNTDEGLSLRSTALSYSYDKTEIVLKSITMQVEANTKISITGPVGSGKTTLLDVLSNTLTDYEGDYFMNDVNLKNYTNQSVRRYIGKYSHHNEIFGGTLFENITMNRPNISEESIREVAQKIGFGNFLSQFSLGSNTILDMIGKSLSSTAIKKILLLRALCNQPKLLLLDEPFEGLTSQEKVTFENYLLTLSKTTVLVITDDEAFSRKCHSSWIMNNGTLINKIHE